MQNNRCALPALGAALLGAPLLTGCGLGTAGVVAAGGGGGTSNSPSTITNLRVEETKTSPAMIRFTVADPEASPASVVFSYEVSGKATEVLTQIPTNPAQLGTSADGVDYEIAWDYPLESELPDSASYVGGVRVQAEPVGGTTVEMVVGLGNDAPEVSAAPGPLLAEVDGVVPLPFRVADSSDDVVGITIEFNADAAGGFPATAWKPARPGGLPAGDPTPSVAVTGQEAPAAGIDLIFFWDTDFDLTDGDTDVLVRFRPDDGTATGVDVTTPVFRVDNNDEPIVQLFNDLVIANPDERRGIPVPFRVIDEEADEVEMIFQWRRESQAFVDLPTDPAQLDALLADPALRLAHRICTPFPRFARGRLVPEDADTVRLHELSTTESWIVGLGLAGRTLEILRHPLAFQPIASTWRINPLVAPLAAIPLGDGLTALVLDASGGGGRLLEIELTTGLVVRAIGSLGAGVPTALALEDGEAAALVALDVSGTWVVERVELATGTRRELALSDGTQPAPVRALASTGTNTVVFTAGSTLFHLDYGVGATARPVLEGLATPWGVVVDPTYEGRIFLAERDAGSTGRVLTVDLDVRMFAPLPVSGGLLERPEALAVSRDGTQLLIVTELPDGRHQTIGLGLGLSESSGAFVLGGPEAGGHAHLATGGAGLALLVQPEGGALLAAGGVEQRRTITSFGTRRSRVNVDLPFDPMPAAGRPWKISAVPGRVRASPEGARSTFLWDSRDAGHGPVFLRAFPRDTEVGIGSEGEAAKAIRSGLGEQAQSLAAPGVSGVVAADVDGDGDVDLIAASSGLPFFAQSESGRFDSNPTTLISPFFGNHELVAAGDLGGDGDVDLATAGLYEIKVWEQDDQGRFQFAFRETTEFGETITALALADVDGDGTPDLVFSQYGTLLQSFTGLVVIYGNSGERVEVSSEGRRRPLSVTVADVDHDGDLDLVSAPSDQLSIHLQTGSRDFDPVPLTLEFPRRSLSGTASVVAADLDVDGDVDLAAAGSRTVVFLQTGSLAFEPEELTEIGNFSVSAVDLVAADLDFDGDLDLVSTRRSQLAVHFQIDAGRFDPRPLGLGDPLVAAPIALAVADFDGDGRADVAVADDQAEELIVILQDPRTFQLERLETVGPPVFQRPEAAAVVDFDGDGDLDVVAVVFQGESELVAFLQTTPGTIDPLPIFNPDLDGSWDHVTAGDIDGDGYADFVIWRSNSFEVHVVYQDPPGQFDANTRVLGGIPTLDPDHIALVDVDGDGDLDIGYSSTFGNLVQFFIQRPGGSFLRDQFDIGEDDRSTTLEGLVVDDLDGDGDVDVAYIGRDSILRLHLQGPAGVFAPDSLGLVERGGGEHALVAGDFDGDGLLDLASSTLSLSGGLAVYSQGPAGRFDTPPLIVTEAPVWTTLTTGDVDGDGREDLITFLADFDTLEVVLAVFRQSSPGRFAAPLFLPLEDLGLPETLSAADLDGDGDLDLILPSTALDDIAVFWGRR